MSIVYFKKRDLLLRQEVLLDRRNDMIGNAEVAIKRLLNDNENNKDNVVENTYGEGYYEGYHDALVDLMNKVGIEHNEEIYN